MRKVGINLKILGVKQIEVKLDSVLAKVNKITKNEALYHANYKNWGVNNEN